MDTFVKGRELIGKTVVCEENGRKFGIVGDLSFITDTGELLNLLITEPTKHALELQLQQDEKGRFLIPFSSVKSVSDFVIVTEKEIF
ncbi:MAG: PRC-barrel domain-containing protein [DPANN group archaeon]|nr:PRC-barrel domain-containing protein [DPANN group archaeon]